MNTAAHPLSYPATVDVRIPERIGRWRPFAQWILAIPHLVIAGALDYASRAVAIISWFAILLTGRLPEGLATFQIMMQRYSTRAYAYAAGLHAEYQPFEFEMSAAEPGGTPVDLTIEPDLGERNRVTTCFRLVLAIPAMIWTLLVGLVGVVCWFAGLFAVLFTGRWPAALHRRILAALRVGTRTTAYLTLLTDEYPPFTTA
jgi:hypothetical protein